MANIKKRPTSRNAVYPGVYQPPSWKLPNNGTKRFKDLSMHDIYAIELDDYWKLEVDLPGLSHDEIFVNTDGNQLTIRTCRNGDEGTKCNCKTANIKLPEYVDTDFVAATYSRGLLTIWFRKTAFPVNRHFNQIAVY